MVKLTNLCLLYLWMQIMQCSHSLALGGRREQGLEMEKKISLKIHPEKEFWLKIFYSEFKLFSSLLSDVSCFSAPRCLKRAGMSYESLYYIMYRIYTKSAKIKLYLWIMKFKIDNQHFCSPLFGTGPGYRVVNNDSVT